MSENDHSRKDSEGPPSQPGLGAVNSPAGTIRLGAVNSPAPAPVPESSRERQLSARTSRLSKFGLGELTVPIGEALLAAPRVTPAPPEASDMPNDPSTTESSEAGATTRMTAAEVAAALGELPPDSEIPVEYGDAPRGSEQSVIVEQSSAVGGQHEGQRMPPIPAREGVTAGPVDSGMAGSVGATGFMLAHSISPAMAVRHSKEFWTVVLIAVTVIVPTCIGMFLYFYF